MAHREAGYPVIYQVQVGENRVFRAPGVQRLATTEISARCVVVDERLNVVEWSPWVSPELDQTMTAEECRELAGR